MQKESWIEQLVIVAQVQDHEVFSASGLQLCEWHAAEAIKKRLANEGYDARLTAI